MKIVTYSDKTCSCGKCFTPLSSRQNHCSPSCRFIDIARKHFGKDGCWEWDKSFFVDSGYGQFAETSIKPELAHRMSYRVFVGEIPDDMFICHKCDNRKCFNPAHLFLGTPKDNIHDMISKGRQYDYTSQSRGSEHPHAKLTSEQVEEIYKSFLSGVELSKKFNTTQTNISAIRNGKAWKHLTSTL